MLIISNSFFYIWKIFSLCNGKKSVKGWSFSKCLHIRSFNIRPGSSEDLAKGGESLRRFELISLVPAGFSVYINSRTFKINSRL